MAMTLVAARSRAPPQQKVRARQQYPGRSERRYQRGGDGDADQRDAARGRAYRAASSANRAAQGRLKSARRSHGRNPSPSPPERIHDDARCRPQPFCATMAR